MNAQQSSPKAPHLTPAALVGRRFASTTFKGIRVALAGYCPPPSCLDKYNPRTQAEQFFIHVPPANVQVCTFNGMDFLSIAHIYGGPVSAAQIEELAYYGIETVLAYGLAGGLGTKGLRMGDYYLVEQALVRDGTTPHYTSAERVCSDDGLNTRILDLAPAALSAPITRVTALTGDAIYREYEAELEEARQQGCDIVNCDSSHLFAVSQAVAIRSTECGVLSDVAQSQGEEWQSTLSAMLAADGAEAPGPMQSVGKIVEFYLEVLLPELLHG